MKSIKIASIHVCLLLFFGCFNESLSGTYIGQEDAFLEKLTFISKNKVELTFLGITSEATYIKEKNRVKINNAGESQILIITENGCLDGGSFIGKYCKN